MSKQSIQWATVEVPDPKPLPDLSPELRESLSLLPSHPAMDYLLRRLRRQSAVLESKLKFERQPSIEDYQFLQSGVYWAQWLQRELASLLRHPAPQPQAATPPDAAAFDAIKADLEVLQ